MSAVREQPEQQAPPVQRLRIRYAKRGRLRFTSHRDFSRAFERAVARAGLPMAYSSGFHPHPRISYAGAAPTGSASEAEYVEIGLREVTSADSVRVALDESLPDGLDVLQVVETPTGAGRASLADLLTGSRWRIDLRQVAPGVLPEVAEAFLAREEVLVERMTKKGLRQFDCRAALVSLVVDGTSLDVVLRHGTPAVRPDDLVSGLRLVTEHDLGRPLFTRLEQGVLDEDSAEIADPLV